MPRGIYDRNTASDEAMIAGDPAAVPSSPRAEETRRERRRRDDGDANRMARMKLAIPQDIQDQAKREGKTLRWVRDDAGRMQQMIAEDWDRVPEVPTVAASRTDEGQMVLMAKHADWFEEDRRGLQEQNKALQNAAISGKTHGPDVDDGGFYAPKVTNRISHGG